ncbi:MAG: glycoside hydrolase family 3 N-terminal domain-containing protein [Flavobacteriaceae bacterium]|nr:glycoside hydrolase family 3 N-terminal domain-containing protein [Flavobacteriaceae bacterium]
MKKLYLILLVLFFSFTGISQQIYPLLVENDQLNQKKWVDSIYNSMTLKEKVGQLFMVDVFSSDPKSKNDKIDSLIKNQHIGGIIFSKGGPKRQVKLNNHYQNISKTPLIMAMDAEWGLAMRLDSTFAYPWNMTLGAITNNEIIYKIGKQIGEHAKRIGMHINFSPVVDINTNPKNPIIGNRSFGEDRDNVTEKALSYMRGIQSVGILANAKHFPGHGDTEKDSHKTLPTISFSKKRIDSIELYPYKRLIEAGLSSVMIAHLNVPSLELRANFPSSLSKNIVTNLLQKDLQFNGLVFTDALNMKGASNFKKPGEIDLAAFLAGNDVLLISESIPEAQQLIMKAFNDGRIVEARLERSVKKILYAKYKVGLNNYQPVDMNNLVEDLNTPLDNVLYETAMKNALTVLKNKRLIVPVKKLANTRIAYVHFGDDSGEYFLNQLQKYTKVDWVKAKTLDEYNKKLKEYDLTIIGFHKSNVNPWKEYNFTEIELTRLYEIARNNKVILDVFARPYALLDLKVTSNIEGIIMSYQNSKVSQELSAQLIFGAITAKGSLPVSIGEKFPLNTTNFTRNQNRLQYGTPESVGINSFRLNKIDSLATLGLKEDMMPGAQILVARKGKVIYHKTFGHHTQQKKIKVSDDDVYDVASLTKILATLPMIMELVDNGTINLNTRISELLPDYIGSNKEDITVQQMLSHYAGIKSWIPFYISTLDSLKQPDIKYYSKNKSKKFSIQVANSMFARNDIKDSIYLQIMGSELYPKLNYKYSDLPYYILKEYLENYYDKPMQNLVQQHFYKTLGANNTTYLPLEKFPLYKIPPTEVDDYFRMQKIQGFVNDQGAAILGGVSGHAGLFSNANDIAKIMQMYLWKGSYGTTTYLKPETLDLFNTCNYCDVDVRRGVGFDKPQLEDVGPTCGCVSMDSFGHSGFTGTFTWADPEEEIIYVFFSNRTYPDATNRKIIKNNLRSDIQELIYQSIEY